MRGTSHAKKCVFMRSHEQVCECASVRGVYTHYILAVFYFSAGRSRENLILKNMYTRIEFCKTPRTLAQVLKKRVFMRPQGVRGHLAQGRTSRT